jgi:hypothetical protein
LDTFLESSLEVTHKIIRVGHRSKSEKLESHNLSNLRKAAKTSKLRKDILAKLESGAESKLFSKREHLNKIVTELESRMLAKDDGSKPLFLKGLSTECSEFKKEAAILSNIQQLEGASWARRADIVGMTTSGAANNRSLIQFIDPKIVIIEEAGQVCNSNLFFSQKSLYQHL